MLLLVVLVWGGNFVVMKLAFRDIDRDVFNAARYAVAALVAVPVALAGTAAAARRAGRAGSTGDPPAGDSATAGGGAGDVGGAGAAGGASAARGAAAARAAAGGTTPTARRPRLGPREWAIVILAGLVSNVLYQWTFAAGVDLTSAGKASVLLSTAPLWVALLRRLRGDAIGPGTWLGLALAVVGVAGLVGDRGGGGTLAGDLVMLGAALLWALAITLSRPAVAAAGEREYHAIAMVVGVAGLLAIAAPSLSAETLRPLATGSGLLVLGYAGVLSIGLGFLAWTSAIRHAGPVHVANFQNLVPVVALASEAIVLPATAIGPRQWIAAAAVLLGVWLARRSATRAAARRA